MLDVFEVFLGICEKTKEKKDRVRSRKTRWVNLHPLNLGCYGHTRVFYKGSIALTNSHLKGY